MAHVPKKLQESWELVGGLSNPSKMPCLSYGTPAKECQTGSKLRLIPGTPCFGCYAHKGHCAMPNSVRAQYRRFAAVKKAEEYSQFWIDAMVELIDHYSEKTGVFRWHDTGDLQSREHFLAIVEIARRLPNIRFWIPTQERAYIKGIDTPKNLVVRISCTKIDTYIPSDGNSSGVHSKLPAFGYECPAPNNGGHCGDCRACWDPEVKHVSYKLH